MPAVMASRISSMGRAIVVATALAIPFFTYACAKSGPSTTGDAQAGGKISSVEMTHDFGAVTEGDSLKHTFVLKNDGTANLLLDRVQTSCGCTVAELKKKDIPPGGTGELEVTFNTQGRPGDQNKIITVLSNDPTTPRLNLNIKAKVESLLAFDQPRFAASKSLHVGDTEKYEAWITGKLVDQAKLAVEGTTGGGEDVTTELITKQDGDKQRPGLRVTVKGSKIGNYHGSVTLTTGLEKMPKLVYQFNWNVLGNVDVMPRALYFGVGGPPPPSGKDERIIMVKSRLPDFKLNGAKITSGPFKTQILRPDAGVGYEVHVIVTERDKLEKTTNAGVELATNDPIEPKISVPITISSARPRMGPSGMPMMPPPIAPRPQ